MKIKSKILMDKSRFLSIMEDKIESKSDEIVKSFLDIMLSAKDENGICIDELDLKTVLENGNEVFLGAVQSENEEEFKNLLDEIKVSKGVIVYFVVNEDYPLLKIQDFMGIVEKKLSEDDDIIFGVGSDNSFKENEFLAIMISIS